MVALSASFSTENQASWSHRPGWKTWARGRSSFLDSWNWFPIFPHQTTLGQKVADWSRISGKKMRWLFLIKVFLENCWFEAFSWSTKGGDPAKITKVRHDQTRASSGPSKPTSCSRGRAENMGLRSFLNVMLPEHGSQNKTWTNVQKKKRVLPDKSLPWKLLIWSFFLIQKGGVPYKGQVHDQRCLLIVLIALCTLMPCFFRSNKMNWACKNGFGMRQG